MQRTLLFLILLFFQNTLSAQTSIWEIQKDKQSIYLGGTIHLLREKDYPLPLEYETAYNKSDSIYFETDLTTLESPEAQKMILSSMYYKNGKKLSSVLSKEVYEKLSTYVKLRGLDIKQFDHFKPAMILLTLTIIELKNLGVHNIGVDKYYLIKTLKDKKHIGELESVQTHVNYMSSMGIGHENRVITEALKDLGKTKEKFEKMIDSWRKGKNKLLYKLIVKQMKENTPNLYKSILVERNENWMPVLKSLFKNDKTEFVLVGTAHLVGKDGLLQKFRNLGYHVQRLK